MAAVFARAALPSGAGSCSTASTVLKPDVANVAIDATNAAAAPTGLGSEKSSPATISVCVTLIE